MRWKGSGWDLRVRLAAALALAIFYGISQQMFTANVYGKSSRQMFTANVHGKMLREKVEPISTPSDKVFERPGS